jgi:hypothetical protein
VQYFDVFSIFRQKSVDQMGVFSQHTSLCTNLIVLPLQTRAHTYSVYLWHRDLGHLVKLFEDSRCGMLGAAASDASSKYQHRPNDQLLQSS